jgi:hypothetical protein
MDIRRGKVTGLSSLNGTITGATQAALCSITTSVNHGLVNGDNVSFQGVGGMIQLNGNIYTITSTNLNTFTLNGTSSLAFSAFTTGGYWFQNPMSFQLSFATTSQKDALMQQNADSILDKIDWCCFTDRNGTPIVDAIPLVKYDRTLLRLQADPAYVFPADQLINLNAALAGTGSIYVVSGDYSSSHSELDRNCEDHLIEFAVLRLLRLQSAAEPTLMQIQAEEAVLKRLLDAYRRYRPAIVPIVWQQRSSMRRWF